MLSRRNGWLVAGAAALSMVAASESAHALSFDATLEAFTGDPIQVLVNVDDSVGNGDIRFTLKTAPGEYDITAFYFHISDESLLSGLTATGADITDQKDDANNITQIGGAYNKLNGGGSPGPFDYGIAIGTQGAGGGDFFPTTTFVLSHSTEDLTLAHFQNMLFGARVQSITGFQEGSSKLKGVGGEVVPEPMTAMLTILSAGAVSLAVRRRRHN